jgi:hypothetical protein
VYHIAVRVKHFNEPAHVCALEIVRQVNIHANGCDRILVLICLVENANRKAQVANANLVNAQVSVVMPTLLIVQLVIVFRFHQAEAASMADCSVLRQPFTERVLAVSLVG